MKEQKSTEEWRDVVGYEGNYQVSSHGRVWSVRRIDSRGLTRGGKVMKLSLRNGYPTLALCLNGKHKMHSVHRLVAEAFLSNPEEKKTVNHIDGVKANNHLMNLEWATMKENIIHAHATGLRVGCFGEDNNQYKGAVRVFNMQGKYLYSLKGSKEMISVGFSTACVYRVISGEHVQHKKHKFDRKTSGPYQEIVASGDNQCI